jgi:hypothetical protein
MSDTTLATKIQTLRQSDAALAATCSDYYNHPDFAALRRSIAAVIEATALKLVKTTKPAMLGALAFWSDHSLAVAAITARYGAAWKVTAPFGETVLATLASGLRSCKTERGRS